MLKPIVTEPRDPVGSMGNDVALAVMSIKLRMRYDYFKQRFSQFTNPAIDVIREYDERSNDEAEYGKYQKSVEGV